MWRHLWIICLVLGVVGCRNATGPFANLQRARPDDPTLSIEDQKRFGRDRLARPDDAYLNGPKSGIEGFGPAGR
jgi:hypothetical protein